MPITHSPIPYEEPDSLGLGGYSSGLGLGLRVVLVDGVRFKLRGNTGLAAWTGVLCQAMCENCDPRVVCDFWRRDGLSLARWPIVLLCCVLFKFPKGPCAQTLYTLAPSTNTGIALRRKYILFGRMDHADPKP